MTTLERVAALLQRDFQVPAESLVAEATLESLDIDSLRLIEILFSIEDEFGVTGPEDAAALRERVRTLGELAAYIDTLPQQPKPGA